MCEHLTLGQLVDKLDGYVEEETKGQDHPVRCGFGAAMSYRGDYSMVAFEPQADTRLGQMLGYARRALGATFTGWKGGDFEMKEDTPVWIAKDGDLGAPMTDGLLYAMVGGRLWGGPAPDNSSLPKNIKALEDNFSHAIDCAPFLDFDLESVLKLTTDWCDENGWQLVLRRQVPRCWCVTLDPDRNGWDTINVEGPYVRVVLMRACVLAIAENVKE
jgi:hypothetical protein